MKCMKRNCHKCSFCTLNNQLKNGVITQEEYVLRRVLFRLEQSPKSDYNENLKKRINQKLQELN